jgi:hypothetical protein
VLLADLDPVADHEQGGRHLGRTRSETVTEASKQVINFLRDGRAMDKLPARERGKANGARKATSNSGFRLTGTVGPGEPGNLRFSRVRAG